MTITRFDAGLTEREGDFDDDPMLDTIYIPVPSYNIHSFTFGYGNNTGSLDNDTRFSDETGVDKIAVEEYNLPGFPYKLVIFDEAPANEDINGDMLVEEVNIINPGNDNALLRVKGFLGFFRQDFWSESSTAFCEYIEANNEQLIERFISSEGQEDYSEYGKNIAEGKVVRSTGSSNYGIVDQNGNIIKENIGTLTDDVAGFTPQRLRDLANQIERNEEEIYSIRVEVGDVFYYIAKNGRHYLFAIINIDERDSEGQQDPAIKQRVSIIFSEL
jgi:uncharacterized protein (UPF0335 family)